MRSLVQRLSIGDFVFAQGEGPAYPSAELERQARFENLGGLSFKGPLPKNIGVLRNLRGVKFEANDKLIDLGVLQACGSALRSVKVLVRTRSFHDGHVTIEGLEKLLNMRSFTFESLLASLSEVEVAVKVGTLQNLGFFDVECIGRLRFKGERAAFEQLCTGLRFVSIRHFESSTEDEEMQSSIEMLIAAAKSQGFDLIKGRYKFPETLHPTLGYGSSVYYHSNGRRH
jgi:hypothetical protein